MKRYYFKKSEKEIERLKRDLFYYAQTMGLDFATASNDEGYACEIRRAKDSVYGVAVVIRNSLSNLITIEMGVINWIDEAKLIEAFFPELMSNVQEVNLSFFSGSREKEIRHDVKVLAKVRLGSYFNSRKDVTEL